MVLTAQVLNNCLDCVQNVYSKKLLSTGGYNYVNLQFYTSAAALVVQARDRRRRASS